KATVQDSTQVPEPISTLGLLVFSGLVGLSSRRRFS
ncbi:MAG: PEP-CTERM sorting domain-containing protein, partial [Coleofasciculus sp. C2-GNP5-27]